MGLDPRLETLPSFAWQEADSTSLDAPAGAVLRWSEAVIEAVAPVVPMIKPQSAFFEVLGRHGYEALKRTIDRAKSSDLLVLLDAKRGDIGSTAAAYAKAGLDQDFLEADAMTVNPYFGADGLQPFLDYVANAGKGLFVVVHSSNPSATDTQDLPLANDAPYFMHIADLVSRWGRDFIGQSGFSSVGAVVGATYPEQLAGVRLRFPATPLLLPGYGSQGATAADVVHGFGTGLSGAIVAASRSVCELGEDNRTISREGFLEAVRSRAMTMTQEIVTALQESR